MHTTDTREDLHTRMLSKSREVKHVHGGVLSMLETHSHGVLGMLESVVQAGAELAETVVHVGSELVLGDVGVGMMSSGDNGDVGERRMSPGEEDYRSDDDDDDNADDVV